MKTKPLLLFFLLCCQLTAMAQVGEPRRDLAVGISGGYTLNTVGFNPTVKQSMHGGTTFGLTARYMCEKYFNMLCGLQFELNYTRMGWTEDFDDTDPRTYKRDMDYLHIPLLAHLGFGRERGGAKGYLILGPQLSVFMSEKDYRGGDWTEENNLYDLAMKYEAGSTQSLRMMQHWMPAQKKFEYGLTGGLGFEMSTRSGHHFTLDGRYYFALSDIYRNSKQDPYGRSANGAIMVKLTYMFDIIRTKGI